MTIITEAKTIRNSKTRFSEHNKYKISAVKHLMNNIDHEFTWAVLTEASSKCLKRKILKSYFIKELNLSLNDHSNSAILMLFKTWCSLVFNCLSTFIISLPYNIVI